MIEQLIFYGLNKEMSPNQVCPHCMGWMDWVGENYDALKCRVCGYTYKPNKKIITPLKEAIK